MDTTYAKILVLILLFIGETLSIYAEMVGARSNQISAQPFLQIFLKMFLKESSTSKNAQKVYEIDWVMVKEHHPDLFKEKKPDLPKELKGKEK